MKDVIIKIKGTQGLEGQQEVMEFTTDGKMDFTPRLITLFYDEGQMMEGAKIKTRLELSGASEAVIVRSGTMNSRLVVKKGVRNTCFYSTPFGEMTIGIFGETIENNLSESGGTLKLAYTIDSNSNLISKNEVFITVREVEV